MVSDYSFPLFAFIDCWDLGVQGSVDIIFNSRMRFRNHKSYSFFSLTVVPKTIIYSSVRTKTVSQPVVTMTYSEST